MRAAGYYRPATSDARAGQAALDAIEGYCRDGLHTLARVFGPGDPPVPEREQYRALLSYLDGLGRGEALVVVPAPSHLARTLDELVARLAELQRAGGEVRCTDAALPDPLQNALETLPFAGRPATQSRRIRESLLSKAARGEVLGRTPYGYAAGMDGVYRVVEEEAELVRRLFESYAGPEPPEGEEPSGGPGLRRIAAGFNGEGFRTRSGRPWSPVTLSGMLRNRAYMGSYVRYGMRIALNHDQIVPRELFNRAQRVMASRSPGRRARSRTPYLLSGLARCWACGRALHGVERVRRWTRRDGSRAARTYRYYACPSRASGLPERESGGARHPAWREGELDDAVLEALRAQPEGVLSASFRPPEDDAAAEARKAAEQGFLESVRAVAAGRGLIPDLVPLLDDLAAARAKANSPGDRVVFDDAVNGLISSVLEEQRTAVACLVDRVIVHPERVEPVFRAAPAA